MNDIRNVFKEEINPEQIRYVCIEGKVMRLIRVMLNLEKERIIGPCDDFDEIEKESGKPNQTYFWGIVLDDLRIRRYVVIDWGYRINASHKEIIKSMFKQSCINIDSQSKYILDEEEKFHIKLLCEKVKFPV